ncbi:hypothetical protein U1Q18_043244 [Sarracenia purpurea var. burkii]
MTFAATSARLIGGCNGIRCGAVFGATEVKSGEEGSGEQEGSKLQALDLGLWRVDLSADLRLEENKCGGAGLSGQSIERLE